MGMHQMGPFFAYFVDLIRSAVQSKPQATEQAGRRESIANISYGRMLVEVLRNLTRSAQENSVLRWVTSPKSESETVTINLRVHIGVFVTGVMNAGGHREMPRW